MRLLRWLVLLLLGGITVLAQEDARRLEVRFIDVGQADAILVLCPDGEHSMLIDSGEVPGNFRYPGSSDAFRAHLEAVFEGRPRHIDVAVATHPHSDHIGNMQWVLENFDVDTFVDNGQRPDSTTFANLNAERIRQEGLGELDYINGKESPFAELDFCPDESVSAGILVPWALHNLSDTNDRSIVVWLRHGDKSFLFTGDAHHGAERVLMSELDENTSGLIDVDVLKIGHHGSDTSSDADFIAAVSPEVAVVSSGEKNVGTNKRYKHPRYSTLRKFAVWFKNRSSQDHPLDGRLWTYDADRGKWVQHRRRRGLWATPKDGTVIIRSDGQNLEVELVGTAPD